MCETTLKDCCTYKVVLWMALMVKTETLPSVMMLFSCCRWWFCGVACVVVVVVVVMISFPLLLSCFLSHTVTTSTDSCKQTK